MTSVVPLTVRSPAELIAAVPYLLGFHPSDSLVVVAMRGSRIVFTARYDLPPAGEPAELVQAQARHVAAVVARQEVELATVLGYGVPARVTAAVPALAAALRAVDVAILDELRVTDGRYWSYACAEPGCCPPEGVACDPAATVIPAAATFAGHVALPDRATLATRLAPVTGPARAAMTAATAAAERDLAERLAGCPSEQSAAAQLRRRGRAAVRAAQGRYRGGGVLTDDETAALGVLLAHLPTRDYAWERTGAHAWHLDLWLDVVRRVEPGYAPAPACLLAFAAWRAGQGPLAGVALERALSQDPDYSMAVLLEEVLRYGLPPSALDGVRADHGPAARRHRRGR